MLPRIVSEPLWSAGVVEYSEFGHLVRSGEAVDLLASEYDRRNDYPNFEMCKQMALEAILARLKDGFLKAWTTTCSIDSSRDTGAVSESQIIATWDFHHHNGLPAEVPFEFWAHFHYAGPDRRKFDPVTGDFRFSYTDEDYSSRVGGAYSVFFDARGLPSLAVPSWHGPVNAPFPNVPVTAPVSQGTKGRPPANWWPDFAEELAVFVHDNGPPETQEALIARVLDALAKQGKPEPGRTQIQPVIRRLFDRIGKAGK